MTFGQGKIWYDGKLVDWDDARCHVLSHALHYGSSVFEGLRCYEAGQHPAVFRLRDHVKRLCGSARVYRMEIPFSQEEIEAAILDIVRINELKSCYIRPLVFRGLGTMGLNPLPCPVHCVVAAWSWGRYLGEESLEKGVSVCVSSWRRPAPDTFPTLVKASGNYLNSQLMKMEALDDGYDEAIALDTHGFISEGSGENIFVVRNGIIYTPPMSCAILPGITRDCVFALARDAGVEMVEQALPREMLYLADEVFFSGTATEIVPVSRVDNFAVGDGCRGPVTEQIQKGFLNVVERKAADRHGWLTPVS